jgi:hypothetical protein
LVLSQEVKAEAARNIRTEFCGERNTIAISFLISALPGLSFLSANFASELFSLEFRGSLKNFPTILMEYLRAKTAIIVKTMSENADMTESIAVKE